MDRRRRSRDVQLRAAAVPHGQLQHRRVHLVGRTDVVHVLDHQVLRGTDLDHGRSGPEDVALDVKRDHVPGCPRGAQARADRVLSQGQRTPGRHVDVAQAAGRLQAPAPARRTVQRHAPVGDDADVAVRRRQARAVHAKSVCHQDVSLRTQLDRPDPGRADDRGRPAERILHCDVGAPVESLVHQRDVAAITRDAPSHVHHVIGKVRLPAKRRQGNVALRSRCRARRCDVAHHQHTAAGHRQSPQGGRVADRVQGHLPRPRPDLQRLRPGASGVDRVAGEPTRVKERHVAVRRGDDHVIAQHRGSTKEGQVHRVVRHRDVAGEPLETSRAERQLRNIHIAQGDVPRAARQRQVVLAADAGVAVEHDVVRARARGKLNVGGENHGSGVCEVDAGVGRRDIAVQVRRAGGIHIQPRQRRPHRAQVDVPAAGGDRQRLSARHVVTVQQHVAVGGLQRQPSAEVHVGGPRQIQVTHDRDVVLQRRRAGRPDGQRLRGGNVTHRAEGYGPCRTRARDAESERAVDHRVQVDGTGSIRGDQAHVTAQSHRGSVGEAHRRVDLDVTHQRDHTGAGDIDCERIHIDRTQADVTAGAASGVQREPEITLDQRVGPEQDVAGRLAAGLRVDLNSRREGDQFRAAQIHVTSSATPVVIRIDAPSEDQLARRNGQVVDSRAYADRRERDRPPCRAQGQVVIVGARNAEDIAAKRDVSLCAGHAAASRRDADVGRRIQVDRAGDIDGSRESDVPGARVHVQHAADARQCVQSDRALLQDVGRPDHVAGVQGRDVGVQRRGTRTHPSCPQDAQRGSVDLRCHVAVVRNQGPGRQRDIAGQGVDIAAERDAVATKVDRAGGVCGDRQLIHDVDRAGRGKGDRRAGSDRRDSRLVRGRVPVRHRQGPVHVNGQVVDGSGLRQSEVALRANRGRARDGVQ